MYNNMNSNTFFDSVTAYIKTRDASKRVSDLEAKDLKELENDVQIENEYLDYLFHYDKDIKHIKSK